MAELLDGPEARIHRAKRDVLNYLDGGQVRRRDLLHGADDRDPGLGVNPDVLDRALMQLVTDGEVALYPIGEVVKVQRPD